MTASDFLATILDPGLAFCASVPGWNIPSDDRARVLILSIAGQESGWSERVQSGNGPAHGVWQFERMGGVNGVLHHPATSTLANEVCRMTYVTPDPAHAWGVMATEKGDNLAVAFARLLLWTDPEPLPAIGDEKTAYDYYIRNWRPGRPGPDRWPVVYKQALQAVSNAIQ